MQLPFSEAHTAPTIKPRDTNNTPTTAHHYSSLTAPDGNADVAAIADPSTTQAIESADKTEPLEVVKQTIDALEAQGLLMVFDRHDQVAKRLTGDLMAAGVLHTVQPSQQEAPTHR